MERWVSLPDSEMEKMCVDQPFSTDLVGIFSVLISYGCENFLVFLYAATMQRVMELCQSLDFVGVLRWWFWKKMGLLLCD